MKGLRSDEATFRGLHRPAHPGGAGRRLRSRWRRLLAALARGTRAVALLARDERIPRPLRWVAGIGLLPIPGPFDELVLALIAPIFVAFYRQPVREAWTRAARRGRDPAR